MMGSPGKLLLSTFFHIGPIRDLTPDTPFSTTTYTTHIPPSLISLLLKLYLTFI